MASSIADTIKNRRTIHQFKTGDIPPKALIQLAIENAIWAPNHHLTQPWHFYMIGSETSEQICQLNTRLVAEKKGEKVAEIKRRRWMEVPGWLLLSCDISGDDLKDQEDYAACCCVAQNLSLYLWEQGIGLKWTTGAVTRDPAFFDLLHIDRQKETIVGMFWYGYPAEIPQAERKSSNNFLISLP